MKPVSPITIPASARNKLLALEDKIRLKVPEELFIVSAQTGCPVDNIDRVEKFRGCIREDQFPLVEGNIFTHNHCTNQTLSVSDVFTTVGLNAAQGRAAIPLGGAWYVAPPNGQSSWTPQQQEQVSEIANKAYHHNNKMRETRGLDTKRTHTYNDKAWQIAEKRGLLTYGFDGETKPNPSDIINLSDFDT